MSNQYLIPCEIEQGAFSTERLFRIGGHVFGGYYEHFLDGEKKPLRENTPPPGEVIEGFALCRIIREDEEGGVFVSVPSSDTLLIQKDHLVSS